MLFPSIASGIGKGKPHLRQVVGKIYIKPMLKFMQFLLRVSEVICVAKQF